ncbi:hypothetical protein [Cyanothece sp. BG0011]|uniref:hypothetical protein n=1 Tax=Cyanothece sp. BG0011 TaxID=2082950 RepID=UPI000D1F602D|nr:hypothetical protein [Cyanothece sp. BG0011]
MKKSLLPIANGQSLAMLAKNDNLSEVFNSQGIKTTYEYLQTNIQSGQSFFLKSNDDLLLKTIFVYLTGTEPDKKINLAIKENGGNLIETDLSVIQSTDLTNVFTWEFPEGIIVNQDRYLVITPNFPIQTIILTGEDCNRMSKTLSLSN